MTSRRQLDFFNKLKVKSTYVQKLPKLPKEKPYGGDPNQLTIQGAIAKVKTKAALQLRKEKQSARKNQVRANRSAHKEKGKLYRQSILAANANPVIQNRLNKAGVPNAIAKFPKQAHLETGNFNFGKGFTERTFYGGAKLSSQTQAAQAKNILKRAKRLKKISVKAVAVATLGSVIASGINAKVTASKVPKGYKMVFGRLVKVKGE
jgi:hypothetical protein